MLAFRPSFHFNDSFIMPETMYAIPSESLPFVGEVLLVSGIFWRTVFQVSRSWLRLSARAKRSDLFTTLEWATSSSATQCVHHATNRTPRISYSGYLLASNSDPELHELNLVLLSPDSLNTSFHPVLSRSGVSVPSYFFCHSCDPC